MSPLPGHKTRTRAFWRFSSLAVALGASAMVFACTEDATQTTAPIDLTPAFSTDGIGTGIGYQFTINGGLWEVGWAPETSVGTGVINPFLDCQAKQSTGDIEKCFNTDGDFQYQQHRTADTNPLPLNFVPIVDEGFEAREFLLDGHEADNDFTIDEFEVWVCEDAAAATYELRNEFAGPPANPDCTLAYTIAGNAPPINATDQFTSGSGNRYDYRILVPNNLFPTDPACEYNPDLDGDGDPLEQANADGPQDTCGTYIIVWAVMGDAQSTFEEFSTLKRPQVHVVKTPDAQTVDAGTDISFTMLVSNVYGTAEGVVLDDDLPNPGLVNWMTTTAGCTIVAGHLHCDIGTLGEGATFEVVVSASTDDGDCEVYDNTAEVSSTNAGSDDDDGKITVENCKGTIIIKKQTFGGFGQKFSYTTTGTGLSAFDLTTTAEGAAGEVSKTFVVVAGDYYVAETLPVAGWEFLSLVCTDNKGADPVPVDETVNITLVAEHTVTCLYKNNKKAKLTIKKVVTPGSDQTVAFTFTPSNWNGGATFPLKHGESKTSEDLSPDNSTDYGATETVPADWKLINRACVNDADGSAHGFTTPTNGVAVKLGPGDAVTCTFTNEEQAQLTIKKVVTTGSDQTVPFTFTPSNWNGGATFPLKHGESKTSGYLTPDNSTIYDAEETVPAGWKLTDRACVNDADGTAHAFTTPSNGVAVKLGPGDAVTCTFTNQELGILIVQKLVNGTGTFGPFVFTRATMPAGVPSDFSLSNGESSSTGQTLFPGTYTVCEVNPGSNWPIPTASVNGGAATAGTPGGNNDYCWSVDVGPGSAGTVTLVVTNTPPVPETAWAANDGVPLQLDFDASNWATYVEYVPNKTSNFYASQTDLVGTVFFSAVAAPPAGANQIYIQITLSGAIFTGNVKIQDYASDPHAESPAPGQFQWSCTPTDATHATCVVPANNYYAVHAVVIEN